MTPLEELISGATDMFAATDPPKAMRWTPPPADWCTTCRTRHDDRHPQWVALQPTKEQA